MGQDKHSVNRRQGYYVEPEIQLPLTLGLIVVATFEGIFVGWGLHWTIRLAQDWQNARQIFEFFGVLLATLLPLVGFNFWLGSWFTYRLIGPLARIRQAMAEVSRGNLECEIAAREGDFLRSYLEDVNSAIHALRRLIYRDRKYAQEAVDLLTQCQERLEKEGFPEKARSGIGSLMTQAKSRLSIVNAHFTKGQEAL